uniref:MATH domain-containing protein n=1 Tax=Romanomermis culicivorax TaxID=13658 RepID=A0A915JAC1_ROMCU
MSLFVCLCRGDYDSLLRWPFQHRVTLTLLDQNRSKPYSQRHHVTYTLKPSLEKEAVPFLGRPSSERNGSFGAQAFCDVAKIASSLDRDDGAGNDATTGQTAPMYVLDDVMYVKVEVDTAGMVKV